MSWREFSHGTGTECIHTMQALHRLCMQGDQRAQSTRLSGMLAPCMAGTMPQKPAPSASQQTSPVRMDSSLGQRHLPASHHQ